MYCPTCGSEERQLSQYCRACGTDLRSVRAGLERPDAVTASAVSAREHISRAIADKIRETETADQLKKVAEEVLPKIEKFLESPAEKRLRRIRAGVVMALMGFGGALIAFLLTMENSEFIPLLIPGFVFFFIGIAVILNGVLFTVPRKELVDDSEHARAQRELDSQLGNHTALNSPSASPTTNELQGRERIQLRPSVTEHTTHHLKPQ